MRRLVIRSVAVFLLGTGTLLHAWAPLGHQLVGELAQRRLTPEAKLQVAALLREELVPSLAGVAYWADTLRRSDPERFKSTARWHYVNMPPGSCEYLASRDCPEGSCVVEAIETQRRLLQDPQQPFEIRRDALKFIVHFVGDVHQPLHASNHGDRGGNEFRIVLRTDIPPEGYARERYVDGIMNTNLHAVWDYYVLASSGLASSGLEFSAYADHLARVPHSSNLFPWGPAAWAAESCEIGRKELYPPSHDLDPAYLDAMRPLAERRIVAAGERLARLLNEVFAAPSRK